MIRDMIFVLMLVCFGIALLAAYDRGYQAGVADRPAVVLDCPPPTPPCEEPEHGWEAPP